MLCRKMLSKACRQDAEVCEEIALCYDATKVHISEKGEEMDQIEERGRERQMKTEEKDDVGQTD